MPAKKRHVPAAECRLLRRVLERRLVSVGWPAPPRQNSRGIDVGKIGPERLAIAIHQRVRQGYPRSYHDGADAEQHQAVGACAADGQPVTRSQPLPDMSHFAAEFCECCATLNAAL